MKQLISKKLNHVFAMVLMIMALMTGQSNAFAASTFKVTNPTGSKFRITRTGNTAVSETIDWRVVSLSAIAGVHFTGENGKYDGTVTFNAGDSYKDVTISESTPGDNAYKYQNGTDRSYRFEVLDRNGDILASCDRSKTTGTSINPTNAFGQKEVTISSEKITVTDGGYAQAYRSAVVDDYYNASAPKNYLVAAGAKLLMTVTFEARESDDGYQYIQIYANTPPDDNHTDTGAKNGEPGSCNFAHYVAGFTIDGNVSSTFYSYTFPVTAFENDCGAQAHPWPNNTKGNLEQQYFKSNCRSTDGRLIVPADLTSLYVRLNASGNNADNWYCQNLKAHIQAVDSIAPTILDNNYKVSGGRHQKGNTVYVSVAFSEIVTITGGDCKLITSWGDLAYEAGSGSNVLTFKGEIASTASGTLKITGMSGTIQDLAGNSFSNPWSASNKELDATLNDDYVWSASDFNSLGGSIYEIYTTQDLRHLALMVNVSRNTCKGLTFRQTHDITYSHTTTWNNANSTENNYTAIGTMDCAFCGTFDGQGNTISGIRIYMAANSFANDMQGLFGHIGNGGNVKGVNLVDARITGRNDLGGIAGHIFEATVEDCSVAANVCIHAESNSSYYHGGIVGSSQGTVQRCLSRARLTVTDAYEKHSYGAIVGGIDDNRVKDCIAIGATVPNVNKAGAIIGAIYINSSGTQRNYYRACTVAGTANATDVGVGYEKDNSSPHDITTNQGAQALYSLTLPNGVTLTRTALATLPGTGNATYTTGADIDGTPYAYNGALLNLSYDATTIPQGYDVLLSVNKTADGDAVTFTDHGDHTYTIASMPAADITVSVTLIPVISYIDADGNAQSHGCIPIVSDIHSYSYQTFGRTEGWYVVNSDVTDDYPWSSNFLDKAVHIILCDGKTLSRVVNAIGHEAICAKNGSLSIYGQNLGTGRFLATSKSNGISAKNSIDLNGGTVSSISNGSIGIYSEKGNITIRRGNITANGSPFGIMCADGTVTLGCSTDADRITVSGFYATVKVADGQTLTDGISTHTFTGTLNTDQRAALAGKTLIKSLGDIAYQDENGQEQTCSDYTILMDSTIPVDGSDEGSIGTIDQNTWYVARGNYTFNHNKLNALGHVHLLLLDGAALNVGGSESGLSTKYLSIYGQSLGTGTLTATATEKAISVDGNLVVNGGTINAQGGDYGIYVDGGNMTFNGGSLNATGTISGIYIDGDLALGWTNTSDNITASSYSCTGTISVRDKQFFYNGNQLLKGMLYNHNGGNPIGDLSKLNGNTLTPMQMSLFYEIDYIDENGNAQTTPKDVAVIQLTGQETAIGISGETTWYLIDGEINYEYFADIRLEGDVNLILADGSLIDCAGYYVFNASDDCSLTIYAQSTGDNMGSITSWDPYGIPVLNIYGGNISLQNSGNSNPLFNNCSASITGGRVELDTEDKFFHNSTITLGCSSPTDYIYLMNGYSDQYADVIIKDGQMLSDGSHLYSGTLINYNNDLSEYETEVYQLRGQKELRLYNGSILTDNDNDKPAGNKNEDIISTLDDDNTHIIAIQGRTFFRDGNWNTLCLPFDVSDFDDTPFDDATLMTLDVDGTYNEYGEADPDGNYKTGFDAADGTLHLYFKEATSIEAGKPYLVEWENGWIGNYYNPVFNAVVINNSAEALARKTITSSDGKVSFCSTYSTIDFDADNHSVLFLGGSNKLHYPQTGAHIGAFRAYFQLGNGLTVGEPNSEVRGFSLYFDEDSEGIVTSIQNSKIQNNDAIYNLSGQKMSKLQKGINIVNGKKMIVK